jgi:hypothetical protein
MTTNLFLKYLPLILIIFTVIWVICVFATLHRHLSTIEKARKNFVKSVRTNSFSHEKASVITDLAEDLESRVNALVENEMANIPPKQRKFIRDLGLIERLKLLAEASVDNDTKTFSFDRKNKSGGDLI